MGSGTGDHARQSFPWTITIVMYITQLDIRIVLYHLPRAYYLYIADHLVPNIHLL